MLWTARHNSMQNMPSRECSHSLLSLVKNHSSHCFYGRKQHLTPSQISRVANSSAICTNQSAVIAIPITSKKTVDNLSCGVVNIVSRREVLAPFQKCIIQGQSIKW